MYGVPTFVSKDSPQPLTLVEGFKRCSAMLLNWRKGSLGNENVPIILGVSDKLDEWYLNDDKRMRQALRM